jgi:hypothetical protein
MFETLDGGLMSKYWGHVVSSPLVETLLRKKSCFPGSCEEFNIVGWLHGTHAKFGLFRTRFDPPPKFKINSHSMKMHTYIELRRSVGIDRAIYIYIYAVQGPRQELS